MRVWTSLMGPLMGSRSFWKGSEIFYMPTDDSQVKLKAFKTP